MLASCGATYDGSLKAFCEEIVEPRKELLSDTTDIGDASITRLYSYDTVVDTACSS